MRAALCALTLLAASLAAAQDGQRPEVGVVWTARVLYVVDGDSVWVRSTGGGERIKLRLDGIDAPEICQPSGRQARQALQALTQGEPVQVTVWAYDAYGRAIASLRRQRDQLDLAERMVRDGWAWSPGFRWHPGKYAPAEAAARGAGRGLFAAANPEPPTAFRRRHGSCHKA